MIVKRKLFNQAHADRDRLVSSNDSDILAMKKKSTGPSTLGSVAAGLAAGYGTKKLTKSGKLGALAGLATAGAMLYDKSKKKGNKKYNERLEDAQYFAGKKEKMDWNKKMRERRDAEGYI